MALDLCPVLQPLFDRVLTSADMEMLKSEKGILADATRALRVCQNLVKGDVIPTHVDMTILAGMVKLCHDRHRITDEEKLALDALCHAANWIRHPNPATARPLQVITPTSRPQLLNDTQLLLDRVRRVASGLHAFQGLVDKVHKEEAAARGGGRMIWLRLKARTGDANYLLRELGKLHKDYGGNMSDWKDESGAPLQGWPDDRLSDLVRQR